MSKEPLPEFLKDPFAVIPEATGGFSTTLSFADRQRLHKVLQKIHLRWVPNHMLNEYECDKLLDAWGPAVQQKLLQSAIDAKLV